MIFSIYLMIFIDTFTHYLLLSFLSTQPQINTSVYPTIKISLFAAPKTQKIRGPGFTSKSSEKPYFSSIFMLSIMCLSQHYHALNVCRSYYVNTIFQPRHSYGNTILYYHFFAFFFAVLCMFLMLSKYSSSTGDKF